MTAAEFKRDALANRIGSVKQFGNERLVHDHDLAAALVVAIGEVAASQNLDSHRFEVADTGRLEQRSDGRTLRRRHRVAFGNAARLRAGSARDRHTPSRPTSNSICDNRYPRRS